MEVAEDGRVMTDAETWPWIALVVEGAESSMRQGDRVLRERNEASYERKQAHFRLTGRWADPGAESA